MSIAALTDSVQRAMLLKVEGHIHLLENIPAPIDSKGDCAGALLHRLA